jgi:hypothetical protein
VALGRRPRSSILSRVQMVASPSEGCSPSDAHATGSNRERAADLDATVGSLPAICLPSESWVREALPHTSPRAGAEESGMSVNRQSGCQRSRTTSCDGPLHRSDLGRCAPTSPSCRPSDTLSAMLLASEATTVQWWVWVVLGLAALVVIWAIFADLSERAPRGAWGDDRARIGSPRSPDDVPTER